jgi:hypothetical protein
MRLNVALVAGLRGIGQVGAGQTSGYPSHQLCAWPGVSVERTQERSDTLVTERELKVLKVT